MTTEGCFFWTTLGNLPAKTETHQHTVILQENTAFQHIQALYFPEMYRIPHKLKATELPVSVLVVALPMDQEATRVFPTVAGIHVRNQDIFQAQVEPFVFRGVRQKEERPETQRDEGTENQQQDELLGQSQGSPVMREGGRRTQVARRDPAPRKRQQSRGCHRAGKAGGAAAAAEKMTVLAHTRERLPALTKAAWPRAGKPASQRLPPGRQTPKSQRPGIDPARPRSSGASRGGAGGSG